MEDGYALRGFLPGGGSTDAASARPFVKMWKPEDLTADLATLQDRSTARGRLARHRIRKYFCGPSLVFRLPEILGCP